MSRDEPQVDRVYVMVRRVGDAVAWARFTRFHDGSASVYANPVYAQLKGCDTEQFRGGLVTIADESETAWVALWDELRADGLVELDEAKAAGVVPGDWEPPKPQRQQD